MAKAIHWKSLHRTKPFIKVNCAAIPSELLESELFGFEKGASTGARTTKPGRFELANEGTIFLDEIGEIKSSLQAKLLQVLQEKEFSRLGGESSISINSRVIAATKLDLQKAVEEDRFREDLYYCLNVVNISVPPLRERKEEIPSLTQYFLNFYSAHYGKPYQNLSKETEDFFMSYAWPGNIKQLQNTIKRIVILSNENMVVQELLEKQDNLLETIPPVTPIFHAVGQGGEDLKKVGRKAARKAEKEAIGRMLEKSRWNRRETADRLQISYKALLYKIKEYRLDQ